jgi:hypothetical protein
VTEPIPELVAKLKRDTVAQLASDLVRLPGLHASNDVLPNWWPNDVPAECQRRPSKANKTHLVAIVNNALLAARPEQTFSVLHDIASRWMMGR